MDEIVGHNQPTDNYAWAQIPEWILDSKVGSIAIRLFAVLDRYVGANETAWPSRATLARRLGCSVDSVDRAVMELKSIEAITVERRKTDKGEWTSSRYTLWPRTVEVAANVPLRGRKKIPTGGRKSPRGSNPNEITTSEVDDNAFSEWTKVIVAIRTYGRMRRGEVVFDNPHTDRAVRSVTWGRLCELNDYEAKHAFVDAWRGS